MKPVCVPCRRFYRPKKNGFPFVEAMPRGSHRPKAGRAEEFAWKPYKLWMGDLWECPDCGWQIIVGVAGEPLSHHFKPDFATRVQSEGAEVQINDC